MFLRENKRRKDGKVHRCFSAVENRRTGGGATTQRQVLYLGEINDSQQQAWRQTLQVFDEDRSQYCQLSLFPDGHGAATAGGQPPDRPPAASWRFIASGSCVLAHSDQRQLKEKAMHRRRFKAYGRGLHALRRRCRPGQRNRLSRDSLLGKLAVLKQQAGRMSAAVIVHISEEGQRPTPQNFHYEPIGKFRGQSLDRDGSYILRSNTIQEDAATMWSMYMKLVFIEAAFKSMKSDLAILPIFHRLQPRVEANLFVAFMGYCLLAASEGRAGSRIPASNT